jgi:deoxyribose-phosphate aldolase
MEDNIKLLIEKIKERIVGLRLDFSPNDIWPTLNKPREINTASDLCPWIEHTLLKSEATSEDIIKLCEEAKEFNFYGVCVNPIFVELAKKRLKNTKCSVVAVVGFPLGANLSITKSQETQHLIELGADEIDMVIPIGKLKAKDYVEVYGDIRSVVKVTGQRPVKVIIETALLEKEEKVAACLLSMIAGAAFVKTSTGFAKSGATVEDVSLMRQIVEDKLGIKAAGGIKDFQTAKAMIEAGASRLGCSASVKIITEKGGK